MSSNANPLRALCELPRAEAEASGLLYTPREILQQPSVWLDTFELLRQRRQDLGRFLASAGLPSANPPEVVLIGAGSSDFVAQLVAPTFRAHYRCTSEARASTDLLTQSESALLRERRYLFVWFSRSGTTPEAVGLLARLEVDHPSAHHLFVTCNASGAFARRNSAHSLSLVLNDAVNDRGLAMTSSFTCMTLVGLMLGRGVELERFSTPVSELSRLAEKLLERWPPSAQELAQRLGSSAFFLGSGPLKAVAGEAALKVLELSAGRIKTRSDSFLGARHGPLACLDRDSGLVCFLSTSPAERDYELELVREVRWKSLAGVLVLVSPEQDARARALADIYVELDVPARPLDQLRPMLDVLVAQTLGLFCSIACGLLPDSPSPNGAIQRVVTSIVKSP